ncbi:MAG: SH3 domain-containing protein [Clostridia bacterium]|nr:SH3 domain-containing protein [Clostridia bacterium]
MIYLRKCGYKNSEIFKRIISFMLCLVMTCLYTVSGRYNFTANSQTVYSIGYVYSANYGYLNVRDKAGTVSSTVIDQLDNGYQVSVLGKYDAPDGALWYRVSYFKGRTLKYGYVHSINIRFVTAADDPEFEAYLESQNFPETYRQYLRVLHKIKPDWVFKAFHTNLPWSEVYAAETEDGRSCIESSVISSWKSLELYDWANDTYANVGGSGWTQASDEIVAFYLDPRNFLNDQQMFQFELIEYNPASHTELAVETILKGTFMYKTVLYEEKIPADSASGTAAGTKTVTYAQAFIQVAKELDVSPCMLASRVRQEQGTAGTNKLISGTVPGYEGYYNYFNIGATGNNAQDVLINGLKEAVSEGWNSPYKALVGGARKVCNTHIKKGQDTLYLQKFDVEDSYYGLYWHQYMQNIRAASHEGVTVRNSYAQCDILSSAFEFKIPVFLDMPEYACKLPSEDRNPNYKLSNITVKGYSLSPSFKTDTVAYTLVVPYTASTVEISAVPYVSKASVSGTGTVSLKEGNNAIKIICTAENETFREYIINIKREASPNATVTAKPTATSGSKPTSTATATATAKPSTTQTQKPVTSHNISQVYTVNNGSYITGVSTNTKAESFINKIKITNGTVLLQDKDGEVLEMSSKVATGQKIIVKDIDGNTIKEYSIVIYGDVTGDGQINALDYVYLKRHLWGISELTGLYKNSADVSPSKGAIDALDFVYMKRHLWGIADIVQ